MESDDSLPTYHCIACNELTTSLLAVLNFPGHDTIPLCEKQKCFKLKEFLYHNADYPLPLMSEEFLEKLLNLEEDRKTQATARIAEYKDCINFLNPQSSSQIKKSPQVDFSTSQDDKDDKDDKDDDDEPLDKFKGELPPGSYIVGDVFACLKEELHSDSLKKGGIHEVNGKQLFIWPCKPCKYTTHYHAVKSGFIGIIPADLCSVDPHGIVKTSNKEIKTDQSIQIDLFNIWLSIKYGDISLESIRLE